MYSEKLIDQRMRVLTMDINIGVANIDVVCLPGTLFAYLLIVSQSTYEASCYICWPTIGCLLHRWVERENVLSAIEYRSS